MTVMEVTSNGVIHYVDTTQRKKRATEPQDNTPITESAETITASGEFDEEGSGTNVWMHRWR